MMKIAFGSFVSGISLASMLLTATPAVAAPIKTYQVTGPVLEVTDTTITVEKDKEKWQIARDKETKVTGEIKPGAKVTVQYRMSATTVEVKGDAKADGAKSEGGKADAKRSNKAEEKPAKENLLKK